MKEITGLWEALATVRTLPADNVCVVSCSTTNDTTFDCVAKVVIFGICLHARFPLLRLEVILGVALGSVLFSLGDNPVLELPIEQKMTLGF